MESQIFYRPAGLETAEYIERSLGRISEYARSQTARDGIKVSQGFSEQGVPLLTVQEIKQMGQEDIIGFHRNLPPFRAKRMDWRQISLLSKRHRMPPPALHALPQPEFPNRQTEKFPYIDPDEI